MLAKKIFYVRKLVCRLNQKTMKIIRPKGFDQLIMGKRPISVKSRNLTWNLEITS